MACSLSNAGRRQPEVTQGKVILHHVTLQLDLWDFSDLSQLFRRHKSKKHSATPGWPGGGLGYYTWLATTNPAPCQAQSSPVSPSPCPGTPPSSVPPSCYPIPPSVLPGAIFPALAGAGLGCDWAEMAQASVPDLLALKSMQICLIAHLQHLGLVEGGLHLLWSGLTGCLLNSLLLNPQNGVVPQNVWTFAWGGAPFSLWISL